MSKIIVEDNEILKLAEPKNKWGFSNDEDVVSNMVHPLIQELNKDFHIDNIEKLRQNIFGNASKVCTALFDKIEDTTKLNSFIQKLYDKVDATSKKQVMLYNALYDLAEHAISSPKEADGRWMDYSVAHKNCQYMHLLALVVNEININEILILGESSNIQGVQSST